MKTALVRASVRQPPPVLFAAVQCSIAALVILSWPWPTLAQAESNEATGEKMTWVRLENETALCNDFTRAGFFIRRNNASRNWVIFLESGGLCYDRASCNRRFFVREVRLCVQ